MTAQPRIVAVTGAGGTMGRVVQRHLGDRYRLRPLVHRPSTGAGEGIELEDLDSLVTGFAGADTVIHLAGAAYVEAPWEEVLAADIVGVRNVYEAAALTGVRKVVFASSNHVTGAYEQDDAPEIYRRHEPAIDEGTEIRADSLYGAAKSFGEVLGRYYVDYRGLSVICLRIGTVRADDDPASADIERTAGWLHLSPAEKLERLASTWLSQRDCATLLAAAIETPLHWAVVYAVSDNPTRMWSLERARTLLGFDPADGSDRPR